MKFRITTTFEYEVVPEHYTGCTTAQQMLDVDLTNLRSDPGFIIDNDLTITGEVVE